MDQNISANDVDITYLQSQISKLEEENAIIKKHAADVEKKLKLEKSVTSLGGTSSNSATKGQFSNPIYIENLEVKNRVLEKQNYGLRQRVLALRTQVQESQTKHTLYDEVPSRIDTGLGSKTKSSGGISGLNQRQRPLSGNQRPQSARVLSKNDKSRLNHSFDLEQIRSMKKTASFDTSQNSDIRELKDRLEKLEKTASQEQLQSISANEILQNTMHMTSNLKLEKEIANLKYEIEAERKRSRNYELKINQLSASQKSKTTAEMNNDFNNSLIIQDLNRKVSELELKNRDLESTLDQRFKTPEKIISRSATNINVENNNNSSNEINLRNSPNFQSSAPYNTPSNINITGVKTLELSPEQHQKTYYDVILPTMQKFSTQQHNKKVQSTQMSHVNYQNIPSFSTIPENPITAHGSDSTSGLGTAGTTNEAAENPLITELIHEIKRLRTENEKVMIKLKETDSNVKQNMLLEAQTKKDLEKQLYEKNLNEQKLQQLITNLSDEIQINKSNNEILEERSEIEKERSIEVLAKIDLMQKNFEVMVKNLKNEQAQNLVKMQELQTQLAVAQKQQESAQIMTTTNAANNTFKTEQLQKNFKLLKNIEHNLNAFIGNANKKTDSQLEELGKLRASMTDMSSTATATASSIKRRKSSTSSKEKGIRPASKISSNPNTKSSTPSITPTSIIKTQPTASSLKTETLEQADNIATDSELIFPDGTSSTPLSNNIITPVNIDEADSNITNPVLPSSIKSPESQIINEADLISFRIKNLILKNPEVFLNEIHQFQIQFCYIDYKFLEQIFESNSVRYNKIMNFETKHDFVVSKKHAVENRKNLIKFMAPFVYARDSILSEGINLEFNLVGESKQEVIELARASINLLEIVNNQDYVNQPVEVFDKNNQVIGQLYLTTRCQKALLSAIEEIKSFRRSSGTSKTSKTSR